MKEEWGDTPRGEWSRWLGSSGVQQILGANFQPGARGGGPPVHASMGLIAPKHLLVRAAEVRQGYVGCSAFVGAAEVGTGGCSKLCTSVFFRHFVP